MTSACSCQAWLPAQSDSIRYSVVLRTCASYMQMESGCSSARPTYLPLVDATTDGVSLVIIVSQTRLKVPSLDFSLRHCRVKWAIRV